MPGSGEQSELHAARQDGARQGARALADQEHDRAGRRLLQQLQERIGTGWVELVRRVDDQHLEAVTGGRGVQRQVGVADLVDGDVAGKLAGLRVERPLQDLQVGMRPVRDHAEDRMVGLGSGALVVGAGEQAAGEAVGERGLADAARAAQQPGMRQAAALPGAEHGALGCLVAEQVRIGLRAGS